ncbi:hypothetical protein CNMCM7927_003877 [Aspergillus lentulus]|nr:hypothetical protein CNMCM7927_003877 [Aspergillus lentulus]
MHLSRLATAPGEKPPGAGWRIAMSPRAGMNPLQTTEVTKRVVFVGKHLPPTGPAAPGAWRGARHLSPETRGGTGDDRFPRTSTSMDLRQLAGRDGRARALTGSRDPRAPPPGDEGRWPVGRGTWPRGRRAGCQRKWASPRNDFRVVQHDRGDTGRAHVPDLPQA